jgi:hypothetical protein
MAATIEPRGVTPEESDRRDLERVKAIEDTKLARVVGVDVLQAGRDGAAVRSYPSMEHPYP